MITALLMSLCLDGAYPHTCTSEEVWVPATWNGPTQLEDCRDEKRRAWLEVRQKAPNMLFKIRFVCETQSQGE